MENEILSKVKKQLQKDYNYKSEDFNNKDTIVTDRKIIKGSRVYSEDEEILKILIFNGKAVISTDKVLKDWCNKYLYNIYPEWMFLYSVLRNIDAKLNEYGYEIDNTHHYYLPKDEVNEIEYDDIKLKWYEKEEIEQFRDDERFDEAFAFDKRYPDILGVAALNEVGEIIGMAGASEDCDEMWQIGINVCSGEEGNGIATKLVTALKDEIIRRKKVPFYGTVESHIVSQKVALASGFYPAFAELKIRRKRE